MALSTNDRPYHRLSAITARIKELLAPAIQTKFWVRAEISSASERGGHFYCDLVEMSTQGQIARMSCRIWQDDLVRIRREFS